MFDVWPEQSLAQLTAEGMRRLKMLDGGARIAACFAQKPIRIVRLGDCVRIGHMFSQRDRLAERRFCCIVFANTHRHQRLNAQHIYQCISLPPAS